MFTGIVEHVAALAAVTPARDGVDLAVDLGPLAADARLGDSICVNGACLTIAGLDGATARFHAGAETLRKTTIAGWRSGTAVNLERALRLGDRLGGHLVAGHVDGVGRLVERRPEGASERFTLVLPDDGSVRAVEKGSIAIDGVSLTTWDCRGARISISVIPHTLEHTTLGTLRPGAPVNLEQDQIGRWVQAMMAPKDR
ncbi:MAG TPA: riboflavin synthase [Planctomycetota bacterium]|nr:riboflavin synthase [Planctomycetota bacterium]